MKIVTCLGLGLIAIAMGLAEPSHGQQGGSGAAGSGASGSSASAAPSSAASGQAGQQAAGQSGTQNQQLASPAQPPGALGQQPSAQSQQPSATSTPLFDPNSPTGTGTANTAAAAGAQQNGSQGSATADRQGTIPATNGSSTNGSATNGHNRSLLSGAQQPDAGGASMPSEGGQRAQLGVWLIETGGPGVRVSRITSGSAADRAGLRSGDIILQVNGRGAASPEAAASLIRQIPIGQAATLTIWRDGDQHQLQAMIEAARESHQVGFRGENSAGGGDLESRTMRLEQQLGMIAQELRQLRQEMAQLRGASGQSAGGGTQRTAGEASENASQPPSTNATVPPPGFGRSDDKAAPPASDATKPAGTNSATDPFGDGAAPPKSEPAPKAGTDSKTDTETDSLFK